MYDSALLRTERNVVDGRAAFAPGLHDSCTSCLLLGRGLKLRLKSFCRRSCMFFCTSCPMFWARPAQTRAKGAVRAPLETAARGYTPWIPNRDTPWVALRRRQVGCLGNLTVGVCLGGESGLCRAAAKGTRPRRFASSSRRTTDNRARRVLATTRCCPLRDEGFSPRSWHSPLVGPHVAILIAWGMAAAGSLARLLTASGGTRSEVVAEIRGVQGGGTPWRRFLGPPVALGRGLGQAAPTRRPHASA